VTDRRSKQISATHRQGRETAPPPLGAYLRNDRSLLISLSRWDSFASSTTSGSLQSTVMASNTCSACVPSLHTDSCIVLVRFPVPTLLLSNCCIIMQFVPACAAKRPAISARLRPTRPTHRRESICSPTTPTTLAPSTPGSLTHLKPFYLRSCVHKWPEKSHED
jgi:hypothetical protein